MWMIVDDQRTIGCDVIVRTPEAAIELISKAGSTPTVRPGVRLKRARRSDAGKKRPVGPRRFALRHRTTLDIPGKWYTSPGRAVAAFKTGRKTCGLVIEEYEIVDDLQRVIKGKKTPKPAVEYALKRTDGTLFGWFKSPTAARSAWGASSRDAEAGCGARSMDVVCRGSWAVEPGMYALLCVRQGHLWASTKGKVWYKTAKAAESAWHQDGRNMLKNPRGWAMVRGREDGTWEALECYVLYHKAVT